MKKILVLIISTFLLSCNGQETKKATTNNKTMDKENLEYITFGGGCFWCVDSVLDLLKGVESTTSGYAGGHTKNPTYEEVCTGETGHAEVVQMAYDPKIISYEQLMDVFYFLHDPTQLNRQGNDVGTQYRSVIFYKDDAEKAKALAAMKVSEATGKYSGKYVTEFTKLDQFYPAEQYHQGYYEANPTQPYCSAVVGPKIAKFKKHFGDLGMLRPEVD